MSRISFTGRGRRAAIRMADLAKDKRLPAQFLRDVGLKDLPEGGVAIPYLDATGQLIAIKQRTALVAKEGSRWPSGTALVPYGQWRLNQASKAGYLILVEGESDCWTLWHHDFPALGIPGANTPSCLTAEDVTTLPLLYVCHEPDQGGDKFIPDVAAKLQSLGYRGRALELRMPDGAKDPNELHAQDPARFKARLQEAMKAATPLGSPPQTNGHHQANGKANGKPAEVLGLATICLASVKPEPVRWLVPGYIPQGKLLLIAGDPDQGKSAWTLDLTARVTTGRQCFGLEYEAPAAAGVLMITCEDDLSDTVVPRLLAAGADLNHVHYVQGVRVRNDQEEKTVPFSLDHYRNMEKTIEEKPDIRLVIIDPAGAYIGRTGIDDHKDSELRALLQPMADLAAKHRVSILLVKHLNKGATVRAIHKVSGSGGYVNAVRAAFLIAPDSDDETRKLFLPIKFNLGSKPAGLSYRLQQIDPFAQDAILTSYAQHLDRPDQARLASQLFHLQWVGAAGVDADTALANVAQRDRGPSKVDQAGEWLVKFLGKHAWPTEEVLEAGRQAGFTRATLFEARKQIGSVRAAKVDGQANGPWRWAVGDPRTQPLRPPPSDSSDSSDSSRKQGEKPPGKIEGSEGSEESGRGPGPTLGLFPEPSAGESPEKF